MRFFASWVRTRLAATACFDFRTIVERLAMAEEMVRVLRKPDGLIVWYDFWLNPTNKQTRGIRPTEIKKLFAKELLTGFARLDGHPVGIVANQPMQKGGVLFNDSADKAARFIWLCDAFEIPLLFLADVPGFMIGTDVERKGIIRHGAKMISAISEATVPKISVIVRKAYGAGLYAMAGPAYDSDAVIALPSAQIAVMGPEPAVNAVFFNKLAELPEDQREARRRQLEDEYSADVDLYKLAANLIVDDVVEPEALRDTLIKRFRAYATRVSPRVDRKHGVFPV